LQISYFITEKSNTPLHYAAKSGFSEAISLFLNQDSYIGHLNDFNIPPIADIPESMLSNYFDNCIQMKTDKQTNQCAIEFNYHCLMPPTNASKTQSDDLGTRELEVFMYIANNNNLKQLLKHPLLSSFLHLKWHMIRHLLFGNFVFYAVFYIFLNGYILSMAYESPPNKDGPKSFSIPLREFYVSTQVFEDVHRNNMLQNSIIIMLLIYIFRDIILLLSCPKHYVNDLMNCLHISLIALSIAMLCGDLLCLSPDLQLNIGVSVILISTWKLMILISQYPRFTTGIVIFQTVFWNFVCLFLPYISLVVAFALVFQIFFKNREDPNFKDSNLFFSISKTIIMLTGEFDIDDVTFEEDLKEKSMWIRFVFVIFVLLMVIVLMNMINGMAVSDTAEILCKTELVGLIERIRLIAYFENTACAIDRSLRRWSFKRNSFAGLASRIFLFQNYLKNGKISFKIEDSLNSHEDNDVHSKFRRYNEYCAIWKMDHNIIERAKQIIFNKNQQSDNEKIMIALNKLQEAMGIAKTEI
jgi:transient receptor potential cation channel subfamily A member 1